MRVRALLKCPVNMLRVSISAFAAFIFGMALFAVAAGPADGAPRFLNRYAPEPSTQRFIATDGQTQNALTFIPKGKGPHPVILALHAGGSRSTGAIGSFRRYGAAFAPLGYGVVAADYRTGALGGDALYDVLGALDFIEDHVRLDRNRVIIVGESQGAYLAALAATRVDVYAIICTGGFYNLAAYMRETLKDARSPALRNFYELTVSELGEPGEEAGGAYAPRSPAVMIEYLEARVLLFHGENDIETSWRYSQEFADSIQLAGKKVDFYVVPGAGQGLNVTGDSTADAVIKFLTELELPVPDEAEMPVKNGGGMAADES